MPGIGIIHNPRSRQNAYNPERINKLCYILGDNGNSKTTRSAAELDECLREFKTNSIDVLGINGGDGCNHITLTKLIEIYAESNTPLPKIALLRGGTLNTVARAFKIKGRSENLLDSITKKYEAGIPFKTTQTNLVKVNGKYSFIFGNGLIAKFLHTYYTTGTPSPAHGVMTLVRGVGSAALGTRLAKEWFAKSEARVTVDGKPLPITRFSSILAATIKDIGVGFKPFYKASEVPDVFHILFYDCSPMEFAVELPNIYMGRPMSKRLGQDALAKHVIIESEKPFHYTQDGEIYECKDGRMELSAGPRISVIVDL